MFCVETQTSDLFLICNKRRYYVRSDVNGLSICAVIQLVILFVSTIAGIVVILKGNTEAGLGIILAAFSSANAITSKMDTCDRRSTDAKVPTD